MFFIAINNYSILLLQFQIDLVVKTQRASFIIDRPILVTNLVVIGSFALFVPLLYVTGNTNHLVKLTYLPIIQYLLLFGLFWIMFTKLVSIRASDLRKSLVQVSISYGNVKRLRQEINISVELKKRYLIYQNEQYFD